MKKHTNVHREDAVLNIIDIMPTYHHASRASTMTPTVTAAAGPAPTDHAAAAPAAAAGVAARLQPAALQRTAAAAVRKRSMFVLTGIRRTNQIFVKQRVLVKLV